MFWTANTGSLDRIAAKTGTAILTVRARGAAIKNKTFAIAGALFVALGIATLVHPRILMPGKKDEVRVGEQRMIVETRRVVTIPPILGGFFVIAGGGLLFLSARKT